MSENPPKQTDDQGELDTDPSDGFDSSSLEAYTQSIA